MNIFTSLLVVLAGILGVIVTGGLRIYPAC